MVKNVAPMLRTGFISMSKLSNCINPTLESITGTAKNAKMYPPNQAAEEITNSSKSTIPFNLSAVAPIDLWMLISLLRCSRESSKP